MADVTIDLADPIQGHGGLVKQITLREPRYREVMKFGEPIARGYDGNIVYTAENIEIIKSYIAALLKAPDDKTTPAVDALLIEQLSIADTLRLKDAVLDFFSQARLRLEKK